MCIFRSKGLLEVSKICTRSTFKIHNGKGGYLLSLAIKNYPTITIKVLDIIAIESVHERKNSNVKFVTKSFSLNSDFKKHAALVHEDVKTFKCRVCDSKFSLKIRRKESRCNILQHNGIHHNVAVNLTL